MERMTSKFMGALVATLGLWETIPDGPTPAMGQASPQPPRYSSPQFTPLAPTTPGAKVPGTAPPGAVPPPSATVPAPRTPTPTGPAPGQPGAPGTAPTPTPPRPG